jgi:hypothetical protein
MQALKLDAQAGLRWIVAGWRMLRKQPFAFVALLLLFWLVLVCASEVISWIAQGLGAVLPFVSVDLLAAIGSLLFAALTPALTIGFLQACRVADSGLAIHPMMLFSAFRAGRKTLLRLLALGLIQMAVLVAIILMTSGRGAFVAEPPAPAKSAATGEAKPATTDSKPATADATPVAASADDEEMRQKVSEATTQGLAYLPMALLMWYAPMLVAWHGLAVGKSIFFGLVGIWRNRAAFLVYGAAWVVIWMGASIVIGIVGLVVGVGNVAAIIVAPLAMLLLTCMYCSMYQTYATVYVESPTPETIEATDTAA